MNALRRARYVPHGRSDEDRFRAKFVVAESGCWEWTATLFESGYACFWANDKTVAGHRWAYEHFVGPIPEGLYILHSCDNRKCVNPEHLRPGTQRDNVHDMRIRPKPWHRPSGRRLAPEQYERIFAMRDEGYLQREIAAEVDVTQSHVSAILAGKYSVSLQVPAG